MTTPLIMLLLLTGPYLVVRGYAGLSGHRKETSSPAVIGAGLLFLFTGIGHFIQTDIMAEMLPRWVPFRRELVLATGFIEFVVAAGLLTGKYKRQAGWLALGLLISFFPVNVYAAINRIPMGGHAWGPEYLLIRAPLQGIILLWVYWFAIRKRTEP